MKNLWNSKAVNWLILLASAAAGAFLSLQKDHPAFHTHLIAHALIVVFAIEKILADKPTTVADAVKDVLGKTPPAAAFALAMLSTWMAIPGCVPKPTPDGGAPTPTTTFEFCTTDALKSAGANLLGQVANAVATGDYEAELAKLVATFGAAEVKCSVELFVNETQRKASADKLAATEVTNAKTWLAKQKP
jgi:hypothetical protein